MNRNLYTKASFIIAALAIVAVGMFRDPDLANADEIDSTPVASDRTPGYQATPDMKNSDRLSDADLAKLNAPVDGPVPTF